MNDKYSFILFHLSRFINRTLYVSVMQMQRHSSVNADVLYVMQMNKSQLFLYKCQTCLFNIHF